MSISSAHCASLLLPHTRGTPAWRPQDTQGVSFTETRTDAGAACVRQAKPALHAHSHLSAGFLS